MCVLAINRTAFQHFGTWPFQLQAKARQRLPPTMLEVRGPPEMPSGSAAVYMVGFGAKRMVGQVGKLDGASLQTLPRFPPW